MGRRVLKVSDAWHHFAEAEQLLLNLRALAQRGFDAVVACQPESPLWTRARDLGAEVRALPGMRSANPLHRVANVRRIAALVDELQPDVLHAYRSPPHALAAVARRLARHKPLLVRSRGAAQRARRHPLNRWLYRDADVVVASAEVVARDIEGLGVPRERIAVLRGAVDVERVRGGDGAALRSSLGLGDGEFVVGILARLDRVKGHLYAVEALAQLVGRGRPCRLVCAGESWGDWDRRVRDRASSLGVEERVHLLGRVEQVADFLAACDVVVVASVGSETVSRALLEAMAAGRAVVATRVGVIPEILDPGRTGLLVPPADAAALAEALERLFADAALRQRLGRAAAREVDGRYTLGALGAELEEIYERARARRAPG